MQTFHGCKILPPERMLLNTDQVISEGLLILHVLKAILANPQLWLLAVILWKRGEVPGVNLKVPYLDFVHILHFGDLGKQTDTVKLCDRKREEEEQEERSHKLGLTASCSFSRAAVVGSISA